MNTLLNTQAQEARESIVSELQLGHLPADEQEEIIEGVGELLFKRVLLKLFSLLPEAEHDKFEALAKAGEAEPMRALVAKHVSDVDAVISQEMRDGLEDYKRQVFATLEGEQVSTS